MCADIIKVVSSSLTQTSFFFCATKTIMGATWLLHEYTYLLSINNQDYEYQIERVQCTVHGLLHLLRLLFIYNPLKHLSCTTYFVRLFSSVGIIAIHLDVSIIITLCCRYLASTFPTSPIASPCSTSLSQASPTTPCILLLLLTYSHRSAGH